MPPVGFEPMISAGEQPQTYPLYRAATGTGYLLFYYDSLILANLCTVLSKYEVIVLLGVQIATRVFHQSRVYISLLSYCPLTKR
jgi:hypothetical protein